MPYLGRLIDREGKMLYGWKVINRERKTKGIPCLVKRCDARSKVSYFLLVKKDMIFTQQMFVKESLKSL